MTTTFRLRPATTTDIPLLAPIERAGNRQFRVVGHPELDNDDVLPLHHATTGVEEGRVTVAEVESRVVGWTLLLRLGEELCLAQISVDPEYQQRGIATALLEDVVARARRAGEPSVVLNTQSDVPWNRPWYERHGFAVIDPDEWTPSLQEVIEYQTDDGLDWGSRVHMRIDLDPN